jgi:hypothetical protein
MIYGVDSAFPNPRPNVLLELGWEFACGYIGGNALNVWTPGDWQRHRDARLQLMAIWVAPYGVPSRQEGVDAGNEALDAMEALGMTSVLCLDIENGALPIDYLSGFRDSVRAGEVALCVYGSKSTVEVAAQTADSIWLANWIQSGLPLRPAPPDFDMCQYATGPLFNYNMARDDFGFTGFSAGPISG